jgi:hypothetical protein
MWMKLAVRFRGKSERNRLDRAASDPAATQQTFLLDLLRRNADTAFGREHGFADIRSPDEFERRVPIRDFEGFRPYVDRLLAGEQAVLTAEPPFMFTMTSGTAGQPKYIPVTQLSQLLGARLFRQWMYRALRAHPRFLDGASVAVVSPAIEGHTAAGVPYGSASGMIYRKVPRLVRRHYAIPYLVSEIRDYECRYFATARFGLAARVSTIATANPSTLVRLAEIGTSRAEAIIRAVRDGTLGVDLPEQRPLAAELSAAIRPDPGRARILDRIHATTGALRPAECWPELALVACWLGGSVGVQAAKLAAHYGERTPVRDLGYLASEARVTVPCEDGTPSGILAVATNYYEFIPEEAMDERQPPVLGSHELELGKRYYILLTTEGGLYRYDINDVVEVTGFHAQTPMLVFLRKGRDMASITGEKLHVNQVLAGIAEVRQRFGLLIEQFRAAANPEAARYDLFVELSPTADGVSDQRLRRDLLLGLDQALGTLNVEYQQKRKSQRLQAPRLHLMPPGWAEAECRRQVQAGKRDTQWKWQALVASPRPEDVAAALRVLDA